MKVFPMHTSIEDMLAWNPDGFFLSNGPGDPSAMPEVIAEVTKDFRFWTSYIWNLFGTPNDRSFFRFKNIQNAQWS